LTTIPENSKTSNDPTITINGFILQIIIKTVNDKYEDFRLPMQDRVQDLINKMTNEEKEYANWYRYAGIRY
jgi:beta-glucosidase